MRIQSKLDRLRRVLRFVTARLSDYGELLSIELAEARERLLRELIALVALAVCGLFTLSFFCLALIATAWKTPWFLVVVWGIAALWLVASLAALLAFRAQRPAVSFDVLKHELGADLESAREALK
ncbi:phage holin family protein [Paraburkholderia sp. CNPSo 3272]|uniref:phage holin family protein n=1 Tax=Paraburkholderia sp. CNPSo 3272 TaxID=2940931 RepID=UPI0020B7AFA7|nr:phage holin family protein [Paraburkholderia sp. CNPSo 3272]MCP3726268.1 phage holin family protein [Paraburkholderia sp. CNPSo 3272]